MAQESTDPTGIGHREQLEQEEPHSLWFTKTYDDYTVDSPILNSCIKRGKSDNYQITIVMGTWCPDSRQEVPRFYKILDQMVFPMVNTKLILVDKKKDDPNSLAKELEVEFVPTFIIYDKGGKELGRIVEKPRKSLEKDLCKILTGSRK